eukprot:4210784-Prymnesium_polylepis.1
MLGGPLSISSCVRIGAPNEGTTWFELPCALMWPLEVGVLQGDGWSSSSSSSMPAAAATAAAAEGARATRSCARA